MSPSTTAAVRRSHSAAPAIFIVAATMTLMFGIDRVLERMERTELQKEASDDYRTGQRQLREGHAAQAVQSFRKARTLQRTNREYQLGLAAALVAAKRYAEAGDYLRDILASDSNNGPANLYMARLMKAKGQITEADAYYHRAIYGSWGTQTDESNQIRMELTEMLAKNGRNADLLAELLIIQDQTPQDAQQQKRLAQLLLSAGSPSRAADEYRQALKSHPDDPQAYAGLGEAELAQADFHAAQNAFSRALRKEPQNTQVRARLELSSALLALDPTPRGLSSSEKYRRSLRLLQLAAEDLQSCVSSRQLVVSPPVQALLDQAQTMLQAPAPATIHNEDAEARLQVAERLWTGRQDECRAGVSPNDEKLRLIMSKLARM